MEKVTDVRTLVLQEISVRFLYQWASSRCLLDTAHGTIVLCNDPSDIGRP
jgi:hypothetical protein